MTLNEAEQIFAVRLVCAEFYQTSPIPSLDPVHSDFRGAEIKHVPVIRIFGSTPSGEKTCLHIHGVFPYLYVPYTGKEDSDRLRYRLAASLDTAINVSLGSATAKNQHVFKVQLISGMPFYGYHEKEHQYFKIYFYNPGMMRRAANLLQNGAVMNEALQPHEAHIPYVQQFMIDYNLHGMSMVELRRVKHRLSPGVASATFPTDGADDGGEYQSSEITRQSTCRLEADALASDILNRRVIEGELMLNPGLVGIWEEEKARRLNLGLSGGDSQLVHPNSPTRPDFEPTDNDVYQRERLAQRLSVISQQNDDSAISGETASSQSSYPLETEDNSNLINASCIEHHVGPESKRIHPGLPKSLSGQFIDQLDLGSSSIASPTRSRSRQSLDDSSVLDAADISLLDILNGLADENADEPTIDGDSLLGSQCVDSPSPSENRDSREEDKEDEENDDLNLTSLQLDSLSWSQRDEGSQRPGASNSSRAKLDQADDEAAYDYLRELSVFQLDTDENSDDGSTGDNTVIPQCDGPGDSLSTDNVEYDAAGEELFVTCNALRRHLRNSSSPMARHFDATLRPTTTSVTNTPYAAPIARPVVQFHSKYLEARNRSTGRKNRKTTGDPLVSLNTTAPVRVIEIPALDGPADASSSDSDLDVTVDRQENRVCRYGSAATARQEKVTKALGRKGKHDCHEQGRFVSGSRLESPGKSTSKRRLADISSPGKRSTSRLSRCYSPLPLDIIVGKVVSSPMKVPETGGPSLPSIIGHETGGNERCSNLCGIDEEVDVRNMTFTQYSPTQQLRQSAKLAVSEYQSIGNSKERASREIVIAPRFNPPTFDKVAGSMSAYGVPLCRSETPFFGNPADATNRKEVAQKLLRVPTKCLADLPLFESHLDSVTGIQRWRVMRIQAVYPSGAKVERSKMRQRLTGQNKTVIVPLAAAPLPKTVKMWSRAKERSKKSTAAGTSSTGDEYGKNSSDGHLALDPEKSTASTRGLENTLQYPILSNNANYNDVELSRRLGISCGQIEGSTQAGYFKIPCENLQDIKPIAAHQFLTILCLELHIVTRGDLLPDPQHDAIGAIFYAIHNDVPAVSNLKSLDYDYGVLVLDPAFDADKSLGYLDGSGATCPVSYAACEADLFQNLLSVINDSDPDILVGWELESLSWGYLFQRAANIGITLAPKVSRIPCVQKAWEPQTTELNILTEIKMPGRIVLDIWRIMRHEIALQSYTFENLMYHVMHQRLSCPSFATLTRWWEHRAPRARSMVIDHYTAKVVGILKLIEQLDIIGKTTEFARLYGIQFFEVFSRGSQFQVESVMLRLAKPSNYVPVSPSTQQRATMRAPESLPLIMEPESVFYSDPLIVLDFQSLYPSIIIAHNYCFSTCLGRVENIGQSVPYEFGATSLRVTRRTALKLEGKLNFSPCGVAFVKPEVRGGILPRMLTEYLDTRLMVKKAMKDHSQDAHALQRALYSRQRGLKLLANVTFGYTHANFSGRMPCIEIGDSIVSKARETLERAIKLVESTKRWNARVVYGDTDSLFVLLPGRSRNQAFQVGAEIASAVTAANPKPMKLKLEKVMQPSILQTKKRYCGYMYESPEQEKPVYLAKGIETVRRDGCPAVSKILEKSLRILFDTRDVSQVKSYVTRQLDKVLRGRVSIQDLTFAKEFRGLQGYKSTACVPALELTRRLVTKDPRAIPRTSERVPYVIVAGAPNQPLFQCVRSPWELITDIGLRPNTLYYTTRVIIPPLNRCLNLLGVDVNAWFDEMPHRQMSVHYMYPGSGTSTIDPQPQKSTISQYFGTVTCAACGRASTSGICTECCKLPNQTIVILHEKLRQLERSHYSIAAICQSCVGRCDNVECASLDCPVLYRRVRSTKDQHRISYMRRIIEKGNSLEL